MTPHCALAYRSLPPNHFNQSTTLSCQQTV
jgi:hypothetical protein